MDTSANLPSSRNGIPEEVFSPHSGRIMDEQSIMALLYDQNNQKVRNEVPEEQNPFNFDMQGATININHSKDIHFGTKSVIPPLLSTGSELSDQTPLLTPCESLDSVAIPSPSDNFSNAHNFEKLPRYQSCGTPPEVRRFSEGTSNLPPAYRVNFSSSNSSAGSVISGGSVDQKGLQKTMSTPVKGNSGKVSTLQHTAGQMSAAVSNSSNVQMGTQIIYNYYIKDSGNQNRSPRCSTTNISDQQPMPCTIISADYPKNFLTEFREKLTSVYQKRARSSPLPWYRGKQLIKINEYYTEPQFFAVDKFGNKTTEIVNLISVLESDAETRFLVEGEAGMGKTFLATKLAEEWAKGLHLQQFQILFLITLADFKGSLQQYVREELLPSYYEQEKSDRIWEYCKSHEKEILFVLDGYDELQRYDKGEIQNLIKSKDFPESKVLVTCRPNLLQIWEKKIVVSGFGQLQIMEFIDKYFRAIGNSSCGESLRRIIEKDEKYWKLAKRPLFCVLLCMLYITGDVGESLPERQSEIMLQIILCLIKWNRKNNSTASIDFDSLPQEYEKPFYQFGKLCMEALSTEKSRFSDQDVQKVDGFDSKLKQLGFLYNDNENHALGEKEFWKPVHQTFLEYLGAFYMAKHLKECKGCKECKNYDIIFLRSSEVLKFCVGIMSAKAHKLFDGVRYPFLWKLHINKILQLLKEAGPKFDNCRAVARLLDVSTVEISTSEIEFEGWSHILSHNFRRLTTLKIAWRIKSRSPDQESSFIEASEAQYSAFFDALKANESIRCIQVRAKQDGEPFSDEKIAFFFSYLQRALLKKNLQELEIIEMKMTASSHLRAALETVAYQPTKALQDLRVLKLHTFMKDLDLKGICEALQKCASALESLHLEGLEHGSEGFKSLVKLLQSNSNIQYLHVSLNQSLFVNVFGSGGEKMDDYAPVTMKADHIGMARTAVRKSVHAFENNSSFKDPNRQTTNENSLAVGGHLSPNVEKDVEMTGREVDPKKELSFLFDGLKNDHWSMEAMHYWYIRRANSELRIPLPVCISGEHKSVFHFLFSALPQTHVKNLTFNQAAGIYLSIKDLVCLGNAVRKSPHLSVLNLQGLDKVTSYLPLLIGMGQSPSLTSVNLSSSKVVVNDVAFKVICASLQNNTSLRNLALGKWQFTIKDVQSAQSSLSKLLGSWEVSQLDLRHCSVDMIPLNDATPQPTSPVTAPLTAFFSQPLEAPSVPWRTLKSLNIEGVEIKQPSGIVLRGHLLLSGVTNFFNITSLNISVSPSKNVAVDNISVRKFFGLISTELKQLKELKLDYWQFSLQFADQISELTSRLRSCRRLKKVQLQGVNELVSESLTNDNRCSPWCKHTLLHHLISYLPSLKDLSLCNYRINGCQLDQQLATNIGNCLHDHFHHASYSVTFFGISSDVENILYQALKRPPCRVKKPTGSALLKKFEVKCPLNIMKRAR